MKLSLFIFFFVLIGLIMPLQAFGVDPPKVTLISPNDNCEIEENVLDLTFKQTNSGGVACSCSLYLDDVVVQTNSSVPHNTPTTFSVSEIKPGQHWWTVKCTDASGNTGSPYYVAASSRDGGIYQSSTGNAGEWSKLDLSPYTYNSTTGYIEPQIYFMDADQRGQLFAHLDYENEYYQGEPQYYGGYYGDVDHRSLFRRPDEGSAWQILDLKKDEYSNWNIVSMAEDPASEDVYISVSGEGIYKSEDGGINFELLPNSPSSSILYLTVDPTTSDIYAGKFNYSGSSIYKSEDRGDSWNLLEGSPTVYSYTYTTGNGMDVAPNGDVYSTNNRGGVCKSIDKGATWSCKNYLIGGTDPSRTVKAISNDIIFVGGELDGYKIQRSTDAGENWETVFDLSSLGTRRYVNAIEMAPNGDIYIAIDYYSVSGYKTAIYRSTGNGDLGTWTKVLDLASGYVFSQVRVVDNVKRSFTVSSWSHIGRTETHSGFTPAIGNITAEKWSASVGGGFNFYNSPLTADVNDDGKDEIVLVRDRTFVFDGEGNKLFEGGCCFPSWHCASETCLSDNLRPSHPDIADIDNDGLKELVTKGGGVALLFSRELDLTGNLRWYYDNPSYLPVVSGSFTPVIFDLGIVGAKKEIIFATNGGLIVFEEENGLPYLGRNDGLMGVWQDGIGFKTDPYGSVPAVGDINNDGQMEIVVQGSPDIYAFDRWGNNLWQTSTGYDRTGYTILADVVSGNSGLEVITQYTDHVLCLDGDNGSILWDVNIGAGSPNLTAFPSPAVADIDNDGIIEVIAPKDAGGFYVLNGETGAIEQTIESGLIYGSIVIADINADGSLDIIAPTYEDLYVFDKDGNKLWSGLSLTGSAIPSLNSPAISDVDGDGWAEVILIDTSGVLHVLGKDNDPPIVTIEAKDKNNVLIPDGGIVKSEDTDLITISSIASDFSGIQNHKIKYWVNGILQEPIDEWSEGGTHFITIGPLLIGTKIEYQATATDYSLNYSETTKKSFLVEVDTHPPKVFLLSPDDNIETEEQSMQVSFKQIDDVSSSCSCSLYLDDEVIQTNSSVPNDTVTYFTLSNMKPGTNYWTVKCTDEAGNTGSPYYISLVASHNNLYQSDDDGQTWTGLDVLKYFNSPITGEDSIGGVSFLDSTSDGKMFMSLGYDNHYDCDGTYKSVWQVHQATFRKNSDSSILKMIKGDCINGSSNLISSLAEASNGDLYAVNGGIYKSTDKGGIWDQISGPSGCKSVAVSDNGYIFATGSNGVYRSIDNGESFELLSGSPKITITPTAHLIISVNNDIYVASGKYVYKSINNGDNWTIVFTSPYASPGKEVASLFAFNQNTIFAGIKQDDELLGAIYVSYNAGVDWQISLQQQQIYNETDSMEGWTQSIDKSPQGDIYAAIYGYCYSTEPKALVYRSMDLGATWQLSFSSPKNTSNNPSFSSVVENIRRSIIIPSWPEVGREKDHNAYTFLEGGISFVEKYWNQSISSPVDLDWAGLVTADIDGNGKDEIFSINETAQAFDGQGNLLWSRTCGVGWSSPRPCFEPSGYGQISAVGDVDNDGVMEIVFNGYDNEIICRNAATGTLKWFTSSLDIYEDDVITPVIADINNDGLNEIIIHGKNLYVLEGSTGEVLWSKSILNRGTVPALADLNQDGQMDIVVENASDNYLYAFDGQENPLWQVQVQPNYNDVTGYISIADVDNDNKPEVIETCWGEIFVFNGEDGSKLWSKPYAEFPGQQAVNDYGSPAIGDVRTDIAGMEIALGLADPGGHPAQGLFLLNGKTGEIIWSDASIGSVYGSPAIADINSDGELEIIIQTDMVYCFNSSGEIIWSYPAGGRSNVAIADVMDTEGAEVIVFSGGEIYVLGEDNVPPQLVIERVPAGDVYNDDTVIFTSIALDTSGIYYHAVQYRINEGEWATIFECYDSNGDNKCDSDFRDVNPLVVSVDPYTYAVDDYIEYRSTAVDNSFPPNTGYSDIGSFTVLLGNAPPYIQSQEVNYQEYCGSGLCDGAVGFKWIYKDEDGDNEIRYDFKINDVDDVDDLDPEVDKTFKGLSYPDGTENNQQVTVAKSAGENEITYNTTYYWWAKVYDEWGDSGWISGSSFATAAHAYPDPDFTLEPEAPAVDVFAQLCSVEAPGLCDSDISKCYDINNEEVSCSGAEFTWDISGCNGIFVGGTDEHSENPKVKLYSSGQIKLWITDQDGFGPCTISKDIEPKLPYPGWKEIPPQKE